MENILSLKNISKSFGGVHALKNVNLDIKKGEIHCLAGENGSGKSTLIKVISGFYKPDGGEIEIDGKKYKNITPSESIKAGVQVIYQDFSVFPNLSVIENLAYNKVLADGQKFVNKKNFRAIAEEAVSKINFKVDLDALVETLPIADKQLIAISRALLENSKLIIMDEPTTALTKKEVSRLFEIIENLKKNGVTILFVSHKLDEVFEISDNITVLRNGENVISCPTSDIDEDKFAFYMTGRHFENEIEQNKNKIGNTILEVKNLSSTSFENINFQLHIGEILGVAGQLGSGRTELALTLFGLMKSTGGDILIDNKKAFIRSVSTAQKYGIALVPEDRLTEGLFMPQSIIQNITVTQFNSIAKKGGYLSSKKLINESAKGVKDLEIATSNHNLPVQTLSGGNQQKVMLARWLANKPRILILNGPTVGVDIGAKHDIYRLLRNLANNGMAILIVSDDLKEIISTCDRAIVMKSGKMTGELSRDQLNEKILTQATM